MSDVAGKTLWSDQRIARWSGEPEGANGADPAWASLADTGVVLRDWSLTRTPDGALRAQVRAAFADDDPAWIAACWPRFHDVMTAAVRS